MKLTIFTKLLLAIFLGMLVTLGAMMASVQWSFNQGFGEYLRKVEEKRMDALARLLEQEYGLHGGWDFLLGDQRAWFELLRRIEAPDSETAQAIPDANPQAEPPPDPFPQWEPPPEPPFLADPAMPFPAPPPRGHHHFGGPPRHGILRHGHPRLLDSAKAQIAGPPETPEPGAQEILRPLTVDGHAVGWLGFTPHHQVADRLQAAFIEQYAQGNIVIASLALGVSFLVSLALARQFLLPIRRLAAGADDLVAGRYDVRIPVTSQDELGRLAEDFNRLARTLERNEQARRQWVADTSHELRTPLAVLRSEVEALLDGVREPSPERLRSLHAEIMGLGKLVDDLNELSIHDLGALDYRMAPLDLAPLVAEMAEGFRPRFEAKAVGLRLTPESPPALPIAGDAGRLRQVFMNLLENSLRYTDAGGVCEIGLAVEGASAVIVVEDSAPGVPAAAMPRLFERFFRLDKSRSRDLGGAGLGLAICQGIAAAHGGGLAAGASRLGGLRMRVALPLAPPSPGKPP